MVRLRSEAGEACTEGLVGDGHPDLAVSVKDRTLLPEGEAFLRYVVEYLHQSGKKIRDGETLRYGYWMTKFVGDDSVLRVWEHSLDASTFVAGADLTLSFWKGQHDVCGASGSIFAPPRPDQMVVVSEGVFDGDPVQGVRYPSPDHMSGWWVTTDRYDGRPETLRNEHCYHLTARRPDLARYLALQPGFRFSAEDDSRPWFDPDVAAEAPD